MPRARFTLPGGGGSTPSEARGGRGGVIARPKHSPHPARFARDPPPPGEGEAASVTARFMTDAPADTPSVVDRTRPVAAGAPVVAAHFLGRTAAFVLGEEAVLLVGDKGDEQRVAVHDGGILSAASDGAWVITGGDDGKVFVTGAKGDSRARRHRRQASLDRSGRGRAGRRGGLVGRQDGLCDAGQGRAAHARGAVDRRRARVRAQGRAACDRPLQRRHAVVSERARPRPRSLEWKGSHHDVAFSPDGTIPGHRHAGADAAWLARGRRQAHAHVGLFGARALVRLDGRRQVARHRRLRATRAVAVPGQGRTDGQDAAACSRPSRCARPWSPAIPGRRWWRSATPTAPCCWCGSTDGAEVLARKPAGAAVSALAWEAAGTLLGLGTEDGYAGVVDLR